MPALADALGRDGMCFLLLAPLDVEVRDERVELGSPMDGHTGAPGPRVTGAEELTGDPPTGPQRRAEPRPDEREALGGHEEQGEARDEEIGRRWRGLFDPLRPEEKTRGGRCRHTRGERGESFGTPVERDDAPAALEERDRIATDTATEIDGEAGWAPLGREALEGHEHGRTRRPAAGDPVVGRELRSAPHGAPAPTVSRARRSPLAPRSGSRASAAVPSNATRPHLRLRFVALPHHPRVGRGWRPGGAGPRGCLSGASA